MKQFQVPQFIDVEDKILGFVTMRQFFIMLLPLVIGGILYFILDLWLVIILFIPITGVTAVFAFYKPNGMRFSRFLSSFLTFTFKPRLYVWKREEKSVNLGSPQKPLNGASEKNKSLKDKKGNLETGSAVNDEELKNPEKVESEYLEELLNQ